VKKILPKKIGDEIFSKFDYCIMRTMESGLIYASKQFPNFELKEAWFTFKAIKSDMIGKAHQVQMHIRYEADGETFDLDVYVDPKDFVKATSKMTDELKHLNIPIEKRAEYMPYEVRYYHERKLIHHSTIWVRKNA